jgi:hypothetical protein
MQGQSPWIRGLIFFGVGFGLALTFLAGWGIRSCGLHLDFAFLLYPFTFWAAGLPIGLAAFTAAYFIRSRLRPSQAIIGIVSLLLLSLVLGAAMVPGGCEPI